MPWGALTGTKLIRETDPKDPPLTGGTTTIRTTPTSTPTSSGGALTGGAPIRQTGTAPGGAVPAGTNTGTPAPTGGATVSGAITGANATPGAGTTTEKTDASGLNTTLPANQTTPITLQKINAYFTDLLNEDSANWNQYMGGYLRQADIKANRLGFSAGGGGYAQLAGGALGQAALDFGDRQRQTKLAMIDQLIQQNRIDTQHSWDLDKQGIDIWATVAELAGEMPGVSPEKLYNAIKTGDWAGINTGGGDTGAGGQNSLNAPDMGANSPYTNGLASQGLKIDGGQMVMPDGRTYPIQSRMSDIKQAAAELGIDNPPLWMIQELQLYSTVVLMTKHHVAGVGELKGRLRDLGYDTWYMKNGGLDLGAGGEP